MKKRIINSILSLFMVLCVFDGSVFTPRVYAEENDVAEEPVTETVPETEEITETEPEEEAPEVIEVPAEPEETELTEEPETAAEPEETETTEESAEPAVPEEELPAENEEPEAEIYALDEYEIRLVPNGGLIGEQTESGETTVTYTAEDASNVFGEGVITRKGYSFLGWYSDSEFTEQITEETLKQNAGTIETLYAKWEGKTYTVTLYTEYGQFKNEAQQISFDHTFGDKQSVEAAADDQPQFAEEDDFHSKYLKFAGWTTDEDAILTGPVEFEHEVQYSSFSEDGEDVTLYAVFTPLVKKITLYPNGGIFAGETESSESVEISYHFNNVDDLDKLEDESISRSGYAFGGWYDNPEFDGEKVGDYSILMNPDVYTALYAKWEAKTYTVTLHTSLGEFKNGEKTFSFNHTAGEKLSIKDAADDEPNPNEEDAVWFNYWKFAGWTTDSEAAFSGETEYSHTEAYSLFGEDGDNVDLFAVFSLIPHKVTLYPNGGLFEGETATSKSLEIPYDLQSIDQLNKLKDGQISRSGYTFCGWYDNSEFSGDKVTRENVENAPDEFTKLYAKWEPKTYSIILYADGIEFDDKDFIELEHTVDVKTSLKALVQAAGADISPVLNRRGYKFVGWAEDEDATAADYTHSGTYSRFSKDGYDTVLYAVWQPISYSVTVYPNSGILAGDTKTKKSVRKSYTVEEWPDLFGAESITRDGYTFKGWYKDSKFKTPVEEEEFKAEPGTIKKLYAKWEAKSYSVSLDANGGVFINGSEVIHTYHTFGYKTSISKMTGLKTTIPTVRPFGYKFLGWSNDPDADKATFTNTKKYAKFSRPGEGGKHVILYAVWAPVGYSVTLYPNGGIPAGSKKTAKSVKKSYNIESAHDVLFSETSITRSGYTFLGWYKDAKFTTPVSEEEFASALGTIKTLYAKWEPKTYNIELVGNGGVFKVTDTDTVPAVTVQHTVDVPASIKKLGEDNDFDTEPCSYERIGYEFLGWSEDNDATTGKYAHAAAYKRFSEDGTSIRLYAVWRPVTHSVTLYPDNGIFAGETKTVKSVVKKYTSDELPDIFSDGAIKRAGYTFLGWYEDSAFTKKVEQEDFHLSAGSIKTLYAKWEPKTYEINLNGNGRGKVNGYIYWPVDHTAGESFIIPFEPEMYADETDYYSFIGWSANERAAAPDFKKGTAYTLYSEDGDDVILYAVYEPVKFSVTLKPNGGILAGDKKTKTSAKKSYSKAEEIDLTEEGIKRKGYVFGGWYSDAKFTEENKVTMYELLQSKGSIKTLYAKWTKQ